MENQLDLLSETLTISSPTGSIIGKEAYAQYISELTRRRCDAHIVKHAEVVYSNNDKSKLSVDIEYHNIGELPDGAVKVLELHYDIELTYSDGILPLISSIEIELIEQRTKAEFKPSYVETRIRSVLSYWLMLIEAPTAKPALFKEIVTDELNFNFPSGTVDNKNDLVQWAEHTKNSIAASAHQIMNFSYVDHGDNLYTLYVTFDWQGLTHNAQMMDAKTRHTWKLVDNPSDRFAKVKQIDIEILKPFQIVSST